jgi:hypothetical protein
MIYGSWFPWGCCMNYKIAIIIRILKIDYISWQQDDFWIWDQMGLLTGKCLGVARWNIDFTRLIGMFI